MLVLDGIGARRVNDVKVLQEPARHADFFDGGGDRGGRDFVAVLEEVNPICCWHDPGAGEVGAKQGIEKGGLADIDLADNDKDKGILETGDQVFQDVHIVTRAAELLDETGQHVQVGAKL